MSDRVGMILLGNKEIIYFFCWLFLICEEDTVKCPLLLGMQFILSHSLFPDFVELSSGYFYCLEQDSATTEGVVRIKFFNEIVSGFSIGCNDEIALMPGMA